MERKHGRQPLHISITPNPAVAAAKVELFVYDADGNEVQRAEIEKTTDPIEWAGVADGGSPFTNGIYTFRVESSANNEVILDETADVYARVLEVSSENGDSVLVLSGNISVAVTGVTALREAKSS